MYHVQNHIRFRILNACFRQRRYWSKPALLAELEKHDIKIEMRSLERDIAALQNCDKLKYKAPLVYSFENKGYWYKDPNYSIEKINIADEELVSLLFCKHLYNHYKGSSVAKRLDGVFDKVISSSRPNYSGDNEAILVDNTLMYTKGLEHLELLLSAMYFQQPVKITHQKYDDENVNTYTLHPYFLKAYDGRLYVYGKSDKYAINLTFGLDRLLTCEAADVPFIANTKTNPADFFKNIIGVTMGKGPVREIQLRFTRKQGFYVKDKKLHESQTIISDDKNGLTISLQLIPNYELTAVLMQFGKSVKVLSPNSLALTLKKEHNEASMQYEEELDEAMAA